MDDYGLFSLQFKNKEIENKNSVVIGDSKDSINSHLSYATNYGPPFLFSSDTELFEIQAKVFGKRKIFIEK